MDEREMKSEFERRHEQWLAERVDWLYKEVPLILICVVLVCNCMTYLVSILNASTESAWWMSGSLLGLILSIPPMVISHPTKPTMQDVLD